MIIKINDETKELRLTIAGAMKLEDELGYNPLLVFAEPMPKIKDMRKIFKVAGGTDEDFENFFNDHTLKDLLKLSLDIFKDAGLIKKEKDEKNV